VFGELARELRDALPIACIKTSDHHKFQLYKFSDLSRVAEVPGCFRQATLQCDPRS